MSIYLKLLFLILVIDLQVLCLRPTPQIQTPVQTDVWVRKARLAAALSSNATPSLLAHLGSNRSRTHLAVDCPLLANATANHILSRLLAELEVSELVESLGAGQYQTLPQLFETNFLYNIWEAQFNFTKPECARGENYAETTLFGLPKFTQCPPKNWTEAQNRLYYVSFNYQKLPMGYTFDDISLVFNRTYVKNLTLIAPIDTGHWFSCVNKITTHPVRLNCSGWDLNVGTLADLNHLLLAAYYLQNGTTHPSAFFPRIDCTSAATKGGGTRIIGNGLPYSDISVYPYFESNIVGSINFPAGVSHVLAPFLTYWGTAIGQKLQAWCQRWGFPLMWSLCAVRSRSTCYSTWRLLDPRVTNSTRLNITVSHTQATEVARLWDVVHTLPLNNTKQREKALLRLWTNVTRASTPVSGAGSSLLVRALSAGDCSAPTWCVGVEVTEQGGSVKPGRCVCATEAE